jgi:uncharacterized protein (TIGR04255 family)
MRGIVGFVLLCPGIFACYIHWTSLPVAMNITFDRPPVNEVALGRIFFMRPDFLVPHYGLIWERLRDQYPLCQQAAPIFGPTGFITDPQGIALPRIWMLSSDQSRLIQLQQDRHYVNWRQVDGVGEYVRFPWIMEEHQRVSRVIDEFFHAELGSPLQTVGMELSYVNLIPLTAEVELVDQVASILRDVRAPEQSRSTGNPIFFGSQTDWAMPDGRGGLSAKVAAGMQPDGKRMMRLEISATCMPLNGMDEAAWIKQAHDAIVTSFKELTTSAMHETWGLRR